MRLSRTSVNGAMFLCCDVMMMAIAAVACACGNVINVFLSGQAHRNVVLSMDIYYTTRTHSILFKYEFSIIVCICAYTYGTYAYRLCAGLRRQHFDIQTLRHTSAPAPNVRSHVRICAACLCMCLCARRHSNIYAVYARYATEYSKSHRRCVCNRAKCSYYTNIYAYIYL